MLRTDLPELRVTDGYTNVVLCLRKDSLYCESNTYIPKWDISNVAYYLNNKDDYEGWIELEDINPVVGEESSDK
jgi:hypothetical protein